jgi:ParB-like chromosome segregation protein Spo0J
MQNGMTLQRHELSSAFPDLEEPAFYELQEDIKANGLRNPITLYDNKVIDGWHRLRACMNLGLEPVLTELDGDPVDFVIGQNIHRRHLTASQRAMALATCNAWRGIGSNQHDKLSYQYDTSLSIRELADKAKVSKVTAQRAKQVSQKGTEDIKEQVKKGAMTLAQAVQVVDGDKPRKAPKPPAGDDELKKAYQKLAKDYDALQTRYDDLNEQYEETLGNYAELAKEIEILDAIRNNESVGKMKQMQLEIETLTRARDDYMTQVAEMKKQINWWKKQNAVRKSA